MIFFVNFETIVTSLFVFMQRTTFISYLKTVKHYSDYTITAYQNDLNQFFTFLIENYQIHDIRDISHQLIRSWIFDLSNNSISNRTINRKLSTLKTFYRYLRKENIVQENPLSKINPPKANKYLPAFVNKLQMDMLFEDGIFGDNFTGRRDRLIIEMLYFTGMRLSELTNLKDTDINHRNLQLKVLGKRNKERVIPFNNLLKDSVDTYIAMRNLEVDLTPSEGYFFVTKKGKKIYKELVYRIVNTYLGKVSTLNKKSPHVLRHTFATHMLNNGADLNAIKEILGHSSLAATQVYTHNSIEKLKTVYNQAHPRA